MASTFSQTLFLDSVTTTQITDVGRLPTGSLWVQTVDNGFTGTLNVQISLDKQTFVNSSASPIAVPGYVQIPEYARYIRIQTVGPVTGSVTVIIAAHDPQ